MARGPDPGLTLDEWDVGSAPSLVLGPLILPCPLPVWEQAHPSFWLPWTTPMLVSLSSVTIPPQAWLSAHFRLLCPWAGAGEAGRALGHLLGLKIPRQKEAPE